MKNQLYFAYGSNLSREQIRHRCPHVELVQQYTLSGWELAFCPYGDIRENNNTCVHGALYRLNKTDELTMDKYEINYNKIHFDIILSDGTTEKCMTYITQERKQWFKPTEEYFNRIRIGYDDWNIPYDNLFIAYQKSTGNMNTQPPIGNPRPITHKPQKTGS